MKNIKESRIGVGEPSSYVYHGTTLINQIRTYIASTRPAFLTASILPVLAGFALVWGERGVLNILVVFLSVINIALIHTAANVLNDYFDSKNGTDVVNTQRLFPFSGGSRFIQNGVITEKQTFYLGAALMLSGVVLGLIVALMTGPLILVIGLLGGLLAIFYSAPPCLACRGLGDLVIAICFGVLPVVGAVYLQTMEITSSAIWLGAIIGCFVSAILWVNSIPDIEADRQAGKNTLPVRLGRKIALYVLGLWFFAGFVLVLISPLPTGSYLSLLALIPAALASKAAIEGRLMPAIPLTLFTHVIVTVLLGVGVCVRSVQG